MARRIQIVRTMPLLISVVLATLSTAAAQEATKFDFQWFKGNLHTHSLWSDGDEFPEVIAAWYAEHGYNFLALSDHNTLSRGMRWMPLPDIIGRSDEGILQRYQNRFGSDWVETRQDPQSGRLDVRLKPLDEFRCLVERAGSFIMIEGEEISDKSEGLPVHLNVSNTAERIEPVGGQTVREAIANNLRAVLEHEEKSGRNLMLHLNHPNFHYAVTAEDLAHVVQEQFFEVYNGHPGVNHLGDEQHISIERMWDVINAIRLSALNSPPILGIATDDSHEYHGKPGSRPGRGWVMVRSKYLTPEHLIRSLESANFYASSGVTLRDVQFSSDSRTLSLSIAPAEGATYITRFITTLRNRESGESLPKDESIGRVVAEVEGLSPSYTMKDDQLYVRAVVTSSLEHSDPSFDGQFRQAWTQPVGWTIR
ncbi:MAG: hypothetical protein KDB22_14350 [Planctomycetales bacterium]|nr:hypothetical protein [Planctomycetales bacterium]